MEDEYMIVLRYGGGAGEMYYDDGWTRKPIGKRWSSDPNDATRGHLKVMEAMHGIVLTVEPNARLEKVRK